MKRILCMFDYKATTGFATVSQNIIPEVKKAFGDNLHLHILAVNYFGTPFFEYGNTVAVYPASLVGDRPERQDAFGRHELLARLTMEDFDGLFIIQDIGVVAPMIEQLKIIKSDKIKAGKKFAKSMFYFPIDSTPVARLLKSLEFFDTLVAYTEYGRNEILKVRPELRGKIKVILHGVNTSHFFPLSDEQKKEKKKLLFGDHASKYIITNVNRNQPRKDIPTTILAFAEYKKRYDNHALLYLHMNPTDPMGWDLYSIVEQLKLEVGKDVLFPPKSMENAGADISLLNDIYNASDVFVTTTSGEGFGLTILEAMMCKVPVIAPLNTAITEISNGGERMFGLEESYPYVTHMDHLIREQSNYIEVAEKIDQVRNSPAGRAQKTEAAHKYASALTWALICERWVEEFDGLFKIMHAKHIKGERKMIPVAPSVKKPHT